MNFSSGVPTGALAVERPELERRRLGVESALKNALRGPASNEGVRESPDRDDIVEYADLPEDTDRSSPLECPPRKLFRRDFRSNLPNLASSPRSDFDRRCSPDRLLLSLLDESRDLELPA